MPYSLSLPGVTIKVVGSKPAVSKPHHQGDYTLVNAKEIGVDIAGTACFRMIRGAEIEVYPYPGANEEDVQDQLDKWGLMAILHQRRVLNFHASSFVLDGKGIMVCGDSGSGKSSVTAAFSLDDGTFLNDDITAITFKEERPFIEKIEEQISLLSVSITELEVNDEAITGKGFKNSILFKDNISIKPTLNHVFHLSKSEGKKPVIRELGGPEKFSLLRGNICSWEILKGIPGLEAEYMKQLLRICEIVPVISIARPEKYKIRDLALLIRDCVTL